MNSKHEKPNIETVLRAAERLDTRINEAIEKNKTDLVDKLSLQRENYISEILAFQVTSHAELKYKCHFVLNMIKSAHGDPDFVSDVFTSLENDLSNLEKKFFDTDNKSQI